MSLPEAFGQRKPQLCAIAFLYNNIQIANISNDSRILHAIRHLRPHKVTFYVDSNIYFGHSTARANLPFRIEPFAV